MASLVYALNICRGEHLFKAAGCACAFQPGSPFSMPPDLVVLSVAVGRLRTGRFGTTGGERQSFVTPL